MSSPEKENLRFGEVIEEAAESSIETSENEVPRIEVVEDHGLSNIPDTEGVSDIKIQPVRADSVEKVQRGISNRQDQLKVIEQMIGNAVKRGDISSNQASDMVNSLNQIKKQKRK